MTDHPEEPVPFKYRTPMQWNSNGTGFSRNDPWMPKNPNYPTVNVKVWHYLAIYMLKLLLEFRNSC